MGAAAGSYRNDGKEVYPRINQSRNSSPVKRDCLPGGPGKLNPGKPDVRVVFVS